MVIYLSNEFMIKICIQTDSNYINCKYIVYLFISYTITHLFYSNQKKKSKHD